jgi:hypothetical protein
VVALVFVPTWPSAYFLFAPIFLFAAAVLLLITWGDPPPS